MSSLRVASSLVALTLAAAACTPHKDVPAADIPKLTSLEDLMAVQATVADPQMKKAGQPTFSDADYAAFADVSSRIQATSAKAKDWSKGPEFDRFADQLHETAVKLGTAAGSKDAKGSSDALGAMKATCKACHSKFK
ncbi:MAG: hypothetical protein JWP97_5789 [Labilithrix sp.]|nr:hypothetical protein [Labilithrix sp.]